jgi:hypothetical protein
MREDKINNLAQTDVNLRDAILQEEQQLPQMPADLNARLMQRISAQQPRRQRRVWPWIAAACVAAILVVYLTPPKFWQGGAADYTAQTDVRGQCPGRDLPGSRPLTSAADSLKPQQPDVRGLDPGSDLPGTCPLTSRPAQLATAADSAADLAPDSADLPQTSLISDAQPTLVAEAAPQPAAKMKVITERDIPITRPENYQHTPEELALLKKQAAEAYLKWVELELEISRNNLEQAMQK